MKNNNSFSQILKTRESVHCFKGEPVDEECWSKINFLIQQVDSLPSLSEGIVTRLHLSGKPLGNSDFHGELGWVIGSMFTPKDKTKQHLYQVEVAFKLMRLSLEFEKIGISSCITSYSFDQEKILQEAQNYHTMEFEAPLALVFGYKSEKGTLRSKFTQWMTHDSYRLPIDNIVINYKKSTKGFAEKDELISLAARAPSIGNTQTWRIYLETGVFHFYAVSSIPEKFYNLGCFLGAFEPVAKQLKFKGEWVIMAEHPKIEGDYCISYVMK